MKNHKNGQAAMLILVDDDEDDRELFSDALKASGLDITLLLLNSGAELISQLSRMEDQYPDLIFLDLNMPGKNGLGCLSEIRAKDKFSNIPVIIYSTSSYHREIEKSFAAGANLYVPKPDSFSDLVLMLNGIFSLEHLRRFPTEREKFVFKLK
jgi:CheY-like chemotaxis protein